MSDSEVLSVVYHAARMFVKGQPLHIVGIILGLIFVVYAVRATSYFASESSGERPVNTFSPPRVIELTKQWPKPAGAPLVSFHS